MAVFKLMLPLAWNPYQTQSMSLPVCALSKQGHRLLTSLDTASGDTTSSHRLIRKFINSSSKSVALDTLSHLLNSNTHHYSSLALPMYERICEASWFSWNPKLVSSVIASLEKQGHNAEAEMLISDSVQKLEVRERDVALFYCDLIESFSKNGSKEYVFDYYARLKKILPSTSSSVRRKSFEAMVSSLCTLDLPHNAEETLEEMRTKGLKPSGFVFRTIVLAYGRLGLFIEMRRVLNQMESSGYTLDTICFNIVLSSYGAHGELSEMVSWIQKMKKLNTPLSIRTYNTVLNSCPSIISLLQDPELLPLSIEALMEELQKVEAVLIQELIDSRVFVEILKWSSLEGKLDLHGMHLGSVYVIILQWIEELRSRFLDDNSTIPAEVVVVCGLGKHSNIRGESPIKSLVSEMMIRLKSPMRIDRKNIGCFVAKGKNVRTWLCSTGV